MQILIYVVIFSLIATIYLAIKKARSTQKHLTDSDFGDLMKNKLHGDNYHRVVQHLGICEECQEALKEFNK